MLSHLGFHHSSSGLAVSHLSNEFQWYDITTKAWRNPEARHHICDSSCVTTVAIRTFLATPTVVSLQSRSTWVGGLARACGPRWSKWLNSSWTPLVSPVAFAPPFLDKKWWQYMAIIGNIYIYIYIYLSIYLSIYMYNLYIYILAGGF